MVDTYRCEMIDLKDDRAPFASMRPNPSGQWVTLASWREKDIRVQQLEGELATQKDANKALLKLVEDWITQADQGILADHDCPRCFASQNKGNDHG